MKLDAKSMRYLTAEDFRVLAGVCLAHPLDRYLDCLIRQLTRIFIFRLKLEVEITKWFQHH